MTLLELPRRRTAPRTFIEPPPGIARRVQRALDALGDLPAEMDLLPGLRDLAQALIAIADALDNDPDLEPDLDIELEEDCECC